MGVFGMRIETYLDAMTFSHYRFEQSLVFGPDERRYRQYRAFRARILRMFEEKDAEIDKIKNRVDYLLRRELEEWEER